MGANFKLKKLLHIHGLGTLGYKHEK